MPIATAEAINAFISTVLLFGGGIVSGIRQWFDTYDKRLVKGDVPVSPLYPVKRVVFAHPAIAENYADTHASREPMYGSIYVNPRKSNKNSDEPSCVIPKFPYGYRTRIDELDERVPGKRHAWCRHIGLDRAGTVVALPQKPGRELFGSLEKRMLQPYHVVAMLDEMDGLQEGFWKGKTLELGFPPLFHYESSYKDPIAEVVGLGRSYGANVVDISPERNFVAEMQAIATRRAREIDPENTEGAIGVLPVGRVNNEELKRMAEQLQRDETHPEGSVTVDIVSPSSSGSTTLGFDVLVLHGRDDEVVRDFATSFQGVHTNARATMVPVFRDIAEEQRMAQKLGIPAYTIAYESD